MFAQATIDDFLDNVRWHLREAMSRAQASVNRIKAEHAQRGILTSSMTYQRVFAAVRDEFDAGIRTAQGELKRAIRVTSLDQSELRQATIQCLEDFALQAKALIGKDQYRQLGIKVNEGLRSLDQHLSFLVRQFDVGFVDPQEPPVPAVNNAINIETMTASTIQQGSPRANQTVQITVQVEKLRTALETFETAIRSANLPATTRGEINGDIQTIRGQLSKAAPSGTVLQETGKSLRSVVEGITAGVLTPPVLAAAAALWSALGLG